MQLTTAECVLCGWQTDTGEMHKCGACGAYFCWMHDFSEYDMHIAFCDGDDYDDYYDG